MTQLFSQQTKLPSLPEFIILDTTQPFNDFVRSTRTLPTFDIVRNLTLRKKEVIGTIFDSIEKQTDALLCLAEGSIAHAYDELGAGESGDDDLLSDEIYKLGEAIFKQLKDSRAYSGNKLVYQQSTWLGGDLVVQRLDSSAIVESIVEPDDNEVPF